MRVLITGATGYVGHSVSRHLIERGEEVTALVRPRSRPVPLPPGVRVAAGDILDPGSLERAMEGCGAVIHLAGTVKMWLADRSEFDRVNVGGLETTLRVAERMRVNRFLYASSIVALGPTDGRMGDESIDPERRRFFTDYERTKAAADRMAREAAAAGLPVVLLYPGVLYGPGPVTAGNLMYRMLRDCLAGSFPGTLGRGDRRICYAFVNDVADGFHRALRQGRRGEGYILGGENRTLVEFLDCLEQVAAITVRRRRIPFWVAGVIGRLQRWRARWFGVTPDLTDGVVQVYRHEWAYSSRKAEQELGYRITPLADGLRRTVDWMRSEAGEAAHVG